VARIVQRVRSEDSLMNLGFRPNTHWWISHETDTNMKKNLDAFTFLQQIGVSIEQMVASYGKFWLQGLESKFPSLIQRQFKKTVCITILSADTEITEMAPNADNIVGGFNTRNASWVKLRDSICGKTKATSDMQGNLTFNSISSTISTESVLKSAKKILQPPKPELDPISSNLTNYWLSGEAYTLFGKQHDEMSSFEAI